MVLSTTQLRTAWAPACKDSGKNFLEAYKAIDAWLKAFHYQPHTGTGAYNCRQITGGTGYSLHSYPDNTAFTFWNGYHLNTIALAVDINPQQNPYGPKLITDMPRAMADGIQSIRTKNGKQVWRWGGYYAGNKDAMHYEIVCTPADLATGINPATLPQPAKPATPTEQAQETDVAYIVKDKDHPQWWAVTATSKRHVTTVQDAAEEVYVGLAKWDPKANGGKGGPFIWPANLITKRPTVGIP